MPLEAAYLSISDRVDMLNAFYRHHAAMPVLQSALNDPLLGRTALVSSFGAESVVLLHMVSIIKPDTPVVMIDTEMLFPETLEYQRQVSKHLGLTDVQIITAKNDQIVLQDPKRDLHKTDPNACCSLRKTAPLNAALFQFDSWITGRKRFQTGQRASLSLFENEDDTRIKINPLAHWRKQDLMAYIDNNALPRHPLVAKSYPSIGCAPCTTPVARTDNERAGRWRGQEKDVCGIHFGETRANRAALEN